MSHSNKKKLLRVGIYLRLSDEDRNKENKEEDSESIKNQRHLLLEEIEKREDFIFVSEYCDEDLSGAGTYRPEFERLIQDCENRKLDVVLCKSQSRFSRDMEIIEKYLHNKFLLWNIRFIGLADHADTANTGNKKARQINGLVNEWYLEDVSNNIRSAFQAKMRQGEFISPFASYGYEISKEDNNKLIVDQVASVTVKKIFECYLKGMGFSSIAKQLNDQNIPSPSFYKYQNGVKLHIVSSRSREDIKWSSKAIKTILTNELYLGHLIQGKRTTVSYKNHKIRKKSSKEWIRIEHTHEAIISEDMFEKVQKRIKEKTKVSKKNGFVHPFSGKVFCLECKKSMRKKSSGKHDYLVCSNYQEGYGCTNKASLRYDFLEELLLKEINKKIEFFYDRDFLEKLMKSSSCDKNALDLEKQKSDLLQKIKKNKNYFKSLYEDKVNGIITLKQFQSLSESYNQNEILYQKRLISLNDEIKKCKNQKSTEDFEQYKPLEKINRIMIDEFVDQIFIGKLEKGVREIQIKWNFKK